MCITCAATFDNQCGNSPRRSSWRVGEPALLIQAYHFAGVTTFHLGAFQTARDWLQRSLEAGGSHGDHHSAVYGINMAIFCHAYIGHCDWHLGYPDRALNSANQALLVACEVSHPFSVALALVYLAMLHQFRLEPEAALKAAAEARGLCQEYRFDYYGAWSALVRAWAIAEQGQTEEGCSAYDASAASSAQRPFFGIPSGLGGHHQVEPQQDHLARHGLALLQ
jgi:hypothetical protein